MEKSGLEKKLATLRQESGSDGQHIKEVEVQLARTRKRLSGLERESAFSERVAGAYAGSVAFLLGSYHFEDPATGRPLRFAGIGPDGAPLRSADGGFAVSLEGTAPIITRDRMRPLLEAIPVRVVLNDMTALLGAALCASGFE